MTGAIVDYASLQTATLAWLARSTDTDLIAQAPTFIQLFEAEALANPLFRFQQMEERDTSTMNGRYLSLPTGYIEARYVTNTGYNPVYALKYVTPSLYWSTYGSTISGLPIEYTIVDSELAFGPTPDSAYTVEILMLKWNTLSASNTANWLLTGYPHIYLAGTLKWAYDYLGNTEKKAERQAELNGYIAMLEVADSRARWANADLTMRSDTGNP